MILSENAAANLLDKAAERRERLASLLAEAGCAMMAASDSPAIVQTWGYDSESADNRIVVQIRRSRDT